jgi:Protein adenylyltransferase SelO
MLIAGETIDYGPCAFMDVYHAGTVYSSIDTLGRYAYGKQPPIARWNLARFAETLLPLLAKDKDAAVKEAQEAFATALRWPTPRTSAASLGCCNRVRMICLWHRICWTAWPVIAETGAIGGRKRSPDVDPERLTLALGVSVILGGGPPFSQRSGALLNAIEEVNGKSYFQPFAVLCIEEDHTAIENEACPSGTAPILQGLSGPRRSVPILCSFWAVSLSVYALPSAFCTS